MRGDGCNEIGCGAGSRPYSDPSPILDTLCSGGIGYCDFGDAELQNLITEKVDRLLRSATCCQADNLQQVWIVTDNIEGLGTDGAGRPE